MRFFSRKSLTIAASAMALIALPLALGPTVDLPGLDAAAFAKDNGKGGSESNGGGGGCGGGSGSDHGNGGGNGGGGEKKSPPSNKGGTDSPKGKPTQTASVPSKQATPTTSKKKGQSNLAGLNSLKRNFNGLMNSSDPRMEGIRTYMRAQASVQTLEGELANANDLLSGARADYQTLFNSYGIVPFDGDADAYSDISLDGLNARLAIVEEAALDPANLAAIAERDALVAAISAIETSDELVALSEAEDAVAGLTEQLNAALAATSDDALKEALLVAANDNRVAQYGDGYVTPELLAWAKNQLGIAPGGSSIPQ